MIKQVDVVFFVEHKDRELESIKLIAKRLKENGISSVILSVYFHIQYLYIYKAKVFVFPYLINNNDVTVSLIYNMYGDNVKYINMNWEQLISKVNEEYKKPQDEFVKDIVRHIAWNENFKRYLVKHGVKSENIEITGNPANEILYNMLDKQKAWRNDLSKEFSLNIDKKWIFMPMNYGWAFASDRLIQSKISNGYPEVTAWEYREFSKKCLKEFMYFIDDIVKNYDYEIIIRPHPSISEDDYIQVFEQELGYIPKGVILNKAHSIREWIIASNIIGSSWSTSVWDAYNIGKAVFLFTPYERPDWLDVWWNNEVLNIKDVNELCNIKSSNRLISESMGESTLIANMTENLIKIKKKNKIILKPHNISYVLKVLVKYLLCEYLKCKYVKPGQSVDFFKKIIND